MKSHSALKTVAPDKLSTPVENHTEMGKVDLKGIE